MDRTLRSALLRPRHLLATLAVAVLAGGGMVAAAVASAPAAPAAARDPFGVPRVHAGDHGVYALVGPDGPGESPGPYPIRVEFQWLEDGVGHDAAGARVVVNRLLLREETPPDGPRDTLLHLLPGTAVEVWPASIRNETEGEPLNLPIGNRSTTVQAEDWMFAERKARLWCGLRNALQGVAIPLGQPVLDVAACFHDPALWSADRRELAAAGVAGAAPARTASFETRVAGVGHAVASWVYHEQVPYPVEIRFLSGSIPAYRLVAFERGTAPIASSPTPLSPTPARPVLAPRHAWGPDESGVLHPFPLSQAWTQARDDPTFADLRAFLAKHPDAYVARAGYQETEMGGRIDRGWTMAVTDGTDSLGLAVTVQAYEVQGERVLARTVYQPADHWVEGATFLPPDQVPGSLPSVASVMEAWAALSGEPASAADDWRFDLSCGDPGTAACAAHARMSAGRVLHQAAWPPGLPTPSADRFEQSTVTVDGQGRLLHYSHTRRVEHQPSFGSLGAASPPPSSGGDAFSPTPLSFAASPWTFTAGTAAAAGGGALLAGLAYFLWPALKAGSLGLFSRVHTSRLLDHPVRAALQRAIEAHPGVHQQELVRLLGRGNGTVEHHLRKLVQARLVVRSAGRGYTCYFLRGAADRHALAAAPVLKSPVAQAIVEAARTRPGLAPAALARELGVSPPTLSYHLRRLEATGLVEVRDGLRAAA